MTGNHNKPETATLLTKPSNCYNDVDMLIVGMNGKGFVADGGCTYDEYLLRFAYWCYFNSPLMIGCDVRTIDDESLSILKHKELLRIDQDAEVRPPLKMYRGRLRDRV